MQAQLELIEGVPVALLLGPHLRPPSFHTRQLSLRRRQLTLRPRQPLPAEQSN
jgi:hypothetical protein